MANALKFHAVVKGKTLSLPDLSTFEGKRVQVIVVEDETPEVGDASAARKAPRPLGLMRGQLSVADDFDAPLPAETQRYFDGEGDE
jgi:hypothetical protein